ncbi:MAG: carboxypeptidase-like regulatory domain-containing protein [Candidatus Pacebacteria bacterium]|nr:carboxypeptidase-like regulatory domain-containing protein [Candidatus Paceibacterota bacterium]
MKLNKIKNLIFVLIISLISISVFFALPVSASTTDGTIDSSNKYAWGENIGWINFGATNGNVHITDSGLSGSALSETVGWINLSNIMNDGEGNLSGYAWSENTGWIKFNPSNGGVIINSSGEFTGSALSENIGWIIFGGDYKVKTDWRPQSARVCVSWTYSDWSNCSNNQQTRTIISSLPSGCVGGSPVLSQSCSSGGGLPPAAYNPPVPPPQTSINPEASFKIFINDNASQTNSSSVTLTFTVGLDIARMAISNTPDFSGAIQETYQSSKNWVLSFGDGTKTVYAKFCTQWGQCSEIVSDSIVLSKEATIIEKIIEAPEKIIEEIKKLPETIKPLVPEILKPKPPETKPLGVPIEELAPVAAKEAPLVFQGKWLLFPQEPIMEFVLAPLPKAIRALAEKFPTLEKTFKEVGIEKITDVAKLISARLTLPGLAERAGQPTAKIEPNKFALPRGVPFVNLSLLSKQQLPSEIVFAKTGGELIDFNIALSITEKGEPQQKISTISGKPLQLAVKLDKPVKSVKGFVVFKSKESQPTSLEIPFNSLLASIIFANPVFAKDQEKPVRVEEKLVFLEFEYTDPDSDGIYTAEIQAPIAEGEYEIITVMDFEDSELGKKEIRLITVVDPEGYVYTQLAEGKLRIAGAVISLYWLNPATKQYELWAAKEYQQENPQVTDDTGKYSFLVPPGAYYLRAEHPDYPGYQSENFTVKEGSGIHMNIELKTKYWQLKILDWKIILLVVVIFLLAYNFYKDKMRDKLIGRS